MRLRLLFEMEKNTNTGKKLENAIVLLAFTSGKFWKTLENAIVLVALPLAKGRQGARWHFPAFSRKAV